MKPGPAPDPNSNRSRVIRALRVSGGPVADIAARAGVPAVQARRALESLEDQSRASCDRSVRPRLWSWVIDAGEEAQLNDAYVAHRRAYADAIGLPRFAGRRISA